MNIFFCFTKWWTPQIMIFPIFHRLSDFVLKNVIMIWRLGAMFWYNHSELISISIHTPTCTTIPKLTASLQHAQNNGTLKWAYNKTIYVFQPICMSLLHTIQFNTLMCEGRSRETDDGEVISVWWPAYIGNTKLYV